MTPEQITHLTETLEISDSALKDGLILIAMGTGCILDKHCDTVREGGRTKTEGLYKN